MNHDKEPKPLDTPEPPTPPSRKIKRDGEAPEAAETHRTGEKQAEANRQDESPA
jgi:hypothetical protein